MSIINFKNIQKKHGFTLIEILIVLAIISIILGMTLYLGSENIFKLRYKTSKESFLSDFNNFYTNSLESNYINQNRFEELQLEILSGNKGISYNYIGNNFSLSGKRENNLVEIFDIRLDNFNTGDKASLYIKPYNIGCSIKDSNNNTGKNLKFKIITNKVKIYCLEIFGANCKIKEYICTQ